MGIHKNTLGTYERGEREIGAEALARLQAAGWNIEWLLSGQGTPRRAFHGKSHAVSLDPEKLLAAIETVEEGLAVTGRTATAAGKAALVAKVYEVFQSEEAGPMATAQILRLIRTGT